MYDCSICTLERNEWFKTRICFHPIYGQETYPVRIPIEFDENQRSRPIEYGDVLFTEDDLLNWLDDLQSNNFPDTPPFTVLQRFIKNPNSPGDKGEVCLTGLIDFELGEMIDLESACNTYHCLPYAGGIFDQPLYILEFFNIIRSTKNQFERIRFEEMDSKIKTDSGSSIKPKFPRQR